MLCSAYAGHGECGLPALGGLDLDQIGGSEICSGDSDKLIGNYTHR